MSRMLSVLLCLCCLLTAFAGCSTTDGPTAGNQPSPTPADTVSPADTPNSDGAPLAPDDMEQPDPAPAEPVQPTAASDEPLDVASLLALSAELPADQTGLVPAGSLETLVAVLDNMGLFYHGGEQRDHFLTTDGAVVWEEAEVEAPAADMAPTETVNSATGSAGSDHSTTNIQVQGVDEADIIKTDGKYIYWASNGCISVLEAAGAETRQLAVIDTGSYTNDLFLQGDRLVVITTRYEAEPDSWYGREYTCYVVYDVSDPANPTEARRVEIEGYPLDARLIGDDLYFVCSRWLFSLNLDQPVTEADLLPCYRDTAAGEALLTVPAEDILCCPGQPESSYMLVGAFDITGDEPCIPESILGAGSTIYMNAEHLYVARSRWNYDEESDQRHSTELYRFAVADAGLTYDGTATVPGTLLNQYAMDEHNGFFRVATTNMDHNWNESNNLYILTPDLSPAGSITGIAPGETIYSVRFQGDTGYVVTYEQTDPLFVMDLSDPYAPVILGELKIPGYSNYLHPLGDGLLLGIGRHTTELFSRDENGVETVEGTIDKGVKISLFDVSDPANPVELDTAVLGSSWNTSTELEYNPRALFADGGRGVFGIPLYSWNEYRDGEFSGYVLFEADRSGIRLLADIGDSSWFRWNCRLIYIGDTLYLCSEDRVDVYRYDDYAFLGTLELAASRQDEYPIVCGYPLAIDFG